MFMVREQLTSRYESDYPQWETDNVLINPCEVSAKLRIPNSHEEISLEDALHQPIETAEKFLPFSRVRFDEALKQRQK